MKLVRRYKRGKGGEDLTLEGLYKKGLLFLGNVATFNENTSVAVNTMNAFFPNGYNEVTFNALMYYQKIPYMNTMFKLIVDIIVESTKYLDFPIYIKVDVLNTSNILLPLYMMTEVSNSGICADIGFEQLVVPIFSEMRISEVTALLNGLRGKVYLREHEEEILNWLVDELDLLYYFPITDTYAPFVYVNLNHVVGSEKGVRFRIGSFETTESSRITTIGNKMYIETIKKPDYIKKVINLKSKNAYDMILTSCCDYNLLGKKSTIIEDFIRSKESLYQ